MCPVRSVTYVSGRSSIFTRNRQKLSWSIMVQYFSHASTSTDFTSKSRQERQRGRIQDLRWLIPLGASSNTRCPAGALYFQGAILPLYRERRKARADRQTGV